MDLVVGQVGDSPTLVGWFVPTDDGKLKDHFKTRGEVFRCVSNTGTPKHHIMVVTNFHINLSKAVRETRRETLQSNACGSLMEVPKGRALTDWGAVEKWSKWAEPFAYSP